MSKIKKHRLKFIQKTFGLYDYSVKRIDHHFSLVSEKECGVSIQLDIEEFGMTIRCKLYHGTQLISILNPRFSIDLFQESYQYTIESSGKKFMELLELQDTEILHGKRDYESGYYIPKEIKSNFKSFFYNATSDLFKKLSTIENAYDFFEKKFNNKADASIFASKAPQRLTFKSLIGSSDYEFYRSFFLEFNKIAGLGWYGDLSQDSVSRFVTELDKVYFKVNSSAKSQKRAQGIYEMTNEEIIESHKFYCINLTNNELKRANQIEQEALLKDENKRSNIDLINLEDIPKRYIELNLKLIDDLKKLDALKEDILSHPNLDPFKYIARYNNEQPYAGAITSILVMSLIHKALKIAKSKN